MDTLRERYDNILVMETGSCACCGNWETVRSAREIDQYIAELCDALKNARALREKYFPLDKRSNPGQY